MMALVSRLWPYLAVVVLSVGALVGVYQTGVNAERSRGEAASLRVQLETVKRDRAIAEQALARVSRDAAELEAAREEDEEKLNELRKIILDRADSGLTQSELDGLLTIR